MLVVLEADVERLALDDQRRVLLPPERVQLLMRLRACRHSPERGYGISSIKWITGLKAEGLSWMSTKLGYIVDQISRLR